MSFWKFLVAQPPFLSNHKNVDDESSVITEVVEEKVVELEDDDYEDNNHMGYSNDRDRRIREYLNVDKHEYLNRNEYQDIAGEDAQEEWGETSHDGANAGYAEETGRFEASPEIEAHGPRHKYMDSEPIHERTREEDLTATPQENKHLAELIQQRCKYQYFKPEPYKDQFNQKF